MVDKADETLEVERELEDRLASMGRKAFRVIPSPETSFYLRRRSRDSRLLPARSTLRAATVVLSPEVYADLQKIAADNNSSIEEFLADAIALKRAIGGLAIGDRLLLEKRGRIKELYRHDPN